MSNHSFQFPFPSSTEESDNPLFNDLHPGATQLNMEGYLGANGENRLFHDQLQAPLGLTGFGLPTGIADYPDLDWPGLGHQSTPASLNPMHQQTFTSYECQSNTVTQSAFEAIASVTPPQNAVAVANRLDTNHDIPYFAPATHTVNGALYVSSRSSMEDTGGVPRIYAPDPHSVCPPSPDATQVSDPHVFPEAHSHTTSSRDTRSIDRKKTRNKRSKAPYPLPADEHFRCEECYGNPSIKSGGVFSREADLIKHLRDTTAHAVPGPKDHCDGCQKVYIRKLREFVHKKDCRYKGN